MQPFLSQWSVNSWSWSIPFPSLLDGVTWNELRHFLVLHHHAVDPLKEDVDGVRVGTRGKAGTTLASDVVSDEATPHLGDNLHGTPLKGTFSGF